MSEAEPPICWSVEAMTARLVRYADLRPCYNAFIDTRSPGSEAKENFTIIGPGVSENPDQHVHIAEPHGFNIGGARQPPACVNSQHSHDTAEVFVVHSGRWRFDLGERGEDARTEIGPGDVISLPTGMFRGFTATAAADDGSPGFLFAVLGGDDPGRVLWAPQVFDMARDYGLVLLDNGSLVDTSAGQSLPVGAQPMPRTSAEQVASLHRATPEEAERMVWRARAWTAHEPIIGPQAPLRGPHPFTLERLCVSKGVADRRRVAKPEVLFVHEGYASIEWDDKVLMLGVGDTITVPIGLERTVSGEAAIYRVSG
jgi:mannose-6-phosphate isomerase-like protein (cupin superfamily)